MKYAKLLPVILCCMLLLNLSAQNNNQPAVKKHRYAVYGGVGPNYYFNNLASYKNNVNPWNYSLAARLMWEPEHFFSLGLETGYYQLYTVKFTAPSFEPAKVTSISIPVQLVASMRFLGNYYAELSAGQSYMIYKFKDSEIGSFNSTSWSLSDFLMTAGYRHRFKSRISIGSEIKFFYSAKNNDSNIAILLMVGYNL